MSDELQFFDIIGPIIDTTACLAITSSTGGTAVDLTADANVGTAATNGQLLRFYADGNDVYYGFADVNNHAAIVDTSTGTTAGRCQCIAKGTFVDHCLPWLNGSCQKYLYAVCKSAATATLRISPRSLDPINRYKP